MSGDDGNSIQTAIDLVSALPLDTNGFRGAVLLRVGEYQIAGHIEIRASGVVLRGEGDSSAGTVLRGTGTEQRTLVTVLGYKQHQAAAILGLNQGRISEVITGKRYPRAKPCPQDQLSLDL